MRKTLAVMAVLLPVLAGCGSTVPSKCAEGNIDHGGKVCRNGRFVTETAAATAKTDYMASLPAGAQVAVRRGLAGLKRGLAVAGESMDGPPDDVTCAQWLGAPHELLDAFASGIVGTKSDASSPSAASSARDLVARIDDQCVTRRGGSIAGLLARQMVLLLGVG